MFADNAALARTANTCQWQPRSVLSQRWMRNPARPGREQRYSSTRVPGCRWPGLPPFPERVVIIPFAHAIRKRSVRMSYQVLARRWRPQTFAQMVGQEHVLRALVNALERQRLHHAYLLTGTRGVGKTTLARLIAKCLNCEQGVSATPCGECAACREIAEGRFVDLLEVDAASRTKVEDTRDLLENVQYAPARGRFKVYLIDEVHMLSTHSFNALLKTLEEPPPHVKFLLATTDPQRLPATVLSRCLQFHLKNLAPEQIAGHLAHVLDEEGIAFEDEALREIAAAAEGSMRDALSLTDQAIAHCAGRIETVAVTEMLGYVDREMLRTLVDALLRADAAAVLDAIAAMATHGTDFERALADLLALLHRIALVQTVPATLATLHTGREQMADWAQRASAADVQLYYQIGLAGRRDLPQAPDARSGFEMALLRMLAFRPLRAGDGRAIPVPGTGDAAARVQSAVREAVDPGKKPEPEADVASGADQPAGSDRAGAGADQPAEVIAPLARLCDVDASNWHRVLEESGLSGMARSVAGHCVPEAVEGSTLRLVLQYGQEILHQPQLDQRIAAALGARFGEPVTVSLRVAETEAETPAERAARLAALRQREAEAVIETDANVRLLLEHFSARLHRESITAYTVAADGGEHR